MRLREFPKSIGPVSGRAGIQNSDFRVPFLPNAHDASHTGTGEAINKKLFNCLMDSVYLNNFSLFLSQTPIYQKRNLLSSPCQTGSVLGLLPPTQPALKSWSHCLFILYIQSITTCCQSFFLQNSPHIYSLPFKSCYSHPLPSPYLFLDSWLASPPLGSPL